MIVYFFCHPHGPAAESAYEHTIVALAEGLKELNVNVVGNVNYWPAAPDSDNYLSDNYLIEYRPEICFDECDVVVFSSNIYDYSRSDLLPKTLFDSDRTYKLVFIDFADGLITPAYRDEIRAVDIVLKTHYCHKYDYPKNFYPWQFGLTNRIIEAANPLPFSERNNDVLVNFRVDHKLRNLAEKKVMHYAYTQLNKNTTTSSFEDIKFKDALDLHYWTLSGRRHDPEYYHLLGRSKACAAFGGVFENSIMQQHPVQLFRRIGKIAQRLHWLEDDRIFQFDSWRLWESMVSGCVTLHVDFEKYGAILPVMPENGVHYIGIDFSDLEGAGKKLTAANHYETIGNNARTWVLANYSPGAIAERAIAML